MSDLFWILSALLVFIIAIELRQENKLSVTFERLDQKPKLENFQLIQLGNEDESEKLLISNDSNIWRISAMKGIFLEKPSKDFIPENHDYQSFEFDFREFKAYYKGSEFMGFYFLAELIEIYKPYISDSKYYLSHNQPAEMDIENIINSGKADSVVIKGTWELKNNSEAQGLSGYMQDKKNFTISHISTSSLKMEFVENCIIKGEKLVYKTFVTFDKLEQEEEAVKYL